MPSRPQSILEETVSLAHEAAAGLLPELTADQAGRLASAKKRLRAIVESLTAAHLEARAIIDNLRPAEPEFLYGPSPEEITSHLATARAAGSSADFCIDASGDTPAIFTNPEHDFATEIFWAVDTEDQLSNIIDALSPLADRDERQVLLDRRSALAAYLLQPQKRAKAAHS